MTTATWVKTIFFSAALAGGAILWLVWLGGGMVTHPDVQEIVLLIVLVALAPLLKIRRITILTIYVFVMISTGMERHVDLFLTDTPAVSYFATSENRFGQWQQYLPSWFFPANGETVRQLYEGAEDETVPWRDWVPCVGNWIAFLLLLWGTLLCLTALFWTQWADRERLTFPLVFLPLHLTEADEKGILRFTLAKKPLLWIGFSLSCGHFVLILLHAIHPTVPALNRYFDLGQLFTEKPLNAIQPLFFAHRPDIVALGYFAPQDLCFSMFFFYFLLKLWAVIYRLLGYEAGGWTFPFVYEQSTGAYLALLWAYLWVARGHLRRVVKTGAGGSLEEGKAQALPPRFALGGAIVGFLGIVGWSIRMGMTGWVAAGFWFLIFCFAFVLARGRAESGMPTIFVYPWQQAERQFTNWLGSARLAPQGNFANYALMAAFLPLHYGVFPYLMTYQLESLKMAQVARLPLRTMAIVLILAAGLGLLLSFGILLDYYYQYGSNVVGEGISWRQSVAIGEYSRATQFSASPVKPDWTKNIYTAIGFVITLTLFILRSLFLRFPLHPLGFAMTAYYGIVLWGPFLTVWTIKVVLFKIGGQRLYRAFIPFFLGLLLGEVVALGIVYPLVRVFLYPNLSVAPIFA